MTSLGFENYAEALKIYLSKYREVSHDPHPPPLLQWRVRDEPLPIRRVSLTEAWWNSPSLTGAKVSNSDLLPLETMAAAPAGPVAPAALVAPASRAEKGQVLWLRAVPTPADTCTAKADTTALVLAKVTSGRLEGGRDTEPSGQSVGAWACVWLYHTELYTILDIYTFTCV